MAGDEVANGKPAPDMFLLAAERLGVRAGATCIVDRGQPAGRAGRAWPPGMPTIAVCRVPGTEATLADADRVVDFLTADVILAA